MLCVVAPVLHALFVAELEVNITLPPVQNVVGPFAEMVGAGGFGFTVATTVVLVADTQFVVVFRVCA
jgi:hypothetical protein